MKKEKCLKKEKRKCFLLLAFLLCLFSFSLSAEAECISEGEITTNSDNCCDGLKGVIDSEWNSAESVCKNQRHKVCLKLDDGTCSAGEKDIRMEISEEKICLLEPRQPLF